MNIEVLISVVPHVPYFKLRTKCSWKISLSQNLGITTNSTYTRDLTSYQTIMNLRIVLIDLQVIQSNH